MSATRGDIVAAAGGQYASKPRPVLLVQNPALETGDSVLAIPFTSQAATHSEYRIPVNPTEGNGLGKACFLEVDKLSAIRRSVVGPKVGVLEVEALNQAEVLLRGLLELG
ncbi:MAG: type II toxin-antitoxin system PemK/MazF family toxin [Propionibacteriaceae bacterium]|nr:type II toxin-antitoxin system PemK/MazF family toxin [Propionibacteriaceae bacterium]